jgi:hypothetical protein
MSKLYIFIINKIQSKVHPLALPNRNHEEVNAQVRSREERRETSSLIFPCLSYPKDKSKSNLLQPLRQPENRAKNLKMLLLRPGWGNATKKEGELEFALRGKRENKNLDAPWHFMRKCRLSHGSHPFSWSSVSSLCQY